MGQSRRTEDYLYIYIYIRNTRRAWAHNYYNSPVTAAQCRDITHVGIIVVYFSCERNEGQYIV